MAAFDLGEIKKDDGTPPATFNLDGLLPQQFQKLAQLGLQLGQENSVRDLLAKLNGPQVAFSHTPGGQPLPPTTP